MLPEDELQVNHFRWHNHLDPAIKKDAWTEEEESKLALFHQIYGSRWSEIARFLPGRYLYDTVIRLFELHSKIYASILVFLKQLRIFIYIMNHDNYLYHLDKLGVTML